MPAEGSALEHLVARALHTVPIEATLRVLEEVSRFDRYQASHGIYGAAQVVADAARQAGLRDVEIEHFAADGSTHFWTFRSPTSWTPTRARLTATAEDGTSITLDHADQPFLIATYSAPVPSGGLHASLVLDSVPAAKMDGAIVLVTAGRYAQGALMRELQAHGARGFITDSPCFVDPVHGQFSGRIELDAATQLFGFSVTHEQFQVLAHCATQGAQVFVQLDVDRECAMPVVTACLPSSEGSVAQGEVWLTAHLCHPRPGANDNASGVAALFGVARTLSGMIDSTDAAAARKRTVRFVWAPEYVGMAAFLESRLSLHGARASPVAVINLDMVGEDQAANQCPFVVERSPDNLASVLTPVAEHIVGLVFDATRRHPGRWRSVPFLGYSDHALFVGPEAPCPVVQFTHWPDRFNHSAADTLDKVSPLEMRRSVAAATVLVLLAANDFDEVRDDWPAMFAAWMQRDLREAVIAGARGDAAWARGLQRHVVDYHTRLSTRPWDAAETASPAPREAETWVHRGHGPFNVRGMLTRLPEAQRVAVVDAIRREKQVLALLGNIAVRADGTRTRERLLEQASWGLRLPVDDSLRDLVWRAWVDSGLLSRQIA